MSEFFLQYINGPKKGRYLDINQEGETTLGSSKDCDIVLSDPMIADHHLSIFIEDGEITLSDISDGQGVKLEGKAISESVVKEKQNFQIGVVSLRIKNGKSQKSTRSKKVEHLTEGSAESALPAAHSKKELAAQDQEQGLRTNEEAEVAQVEGEDGEIIDSKSNNFAGIAKIGILVCLLFLAIYVFRSIEPSEVKPIIMPYKAGEEKLIDLVGFLKNAGKNSRPTQVKVSDTKVMRAKMYDKSSLYILEFQTKERGESIVEVFDRHNNLLLKFKFIVKGLKESRADRLARLFGSRTKREDRARELVRKASIIEKETPHEAIIYYGEALELLTSISTSSSQYLECRRKMKIPQKVLEERVEKLWRECDDYRKNKEYAEALPFVEKILELLPNVDNLEHQKALIYKKYIRKNIR